MADAVRLGAIGLGGWGSTLAKAAARGGRATIVTCFARSGSARDAFSSSFGCRSADSLEAVLGDDEVEGVLIATPHSTHLELITAAAEAGKHVFVEKPLTLTVKEGREAVEVARRAGVTLQVGHHRRKQAATRRLRALIDAGSLGQVHLLEANLSAPAALNPKPGWRNDPTERPLGGMTALGVHMVDNLQYLAGRATRVTAASKQLLARSPLDDVTTCVIEYDSGPLAQLATSMVIPKIAAVAAFGTGGAAWSEEEGDRLFLQAIDEQSRREEPIEHVDALAEQLVEFADCIRNGARPEVDGETALEVVAVLEAAMVSAASGATVDVDPIR